jgi:hypothetical protein
LGASTVTCGTVTVGAAPVGGVSGAPCCGCGVSAGGVCGVVGVSGAGVCDGATPAKQSSMSAELLSSSKRLLRIDMTTPPSSPNVDAFRAETMPRAASAQPRWRDAGRYRIDVRRWEGRVLGKECFVMPPNQTQRRLRGASARTYSAGAKAPSRPALLRRRDG